MGIDYATYLGPYIVCKTEIEDAKATMKSCTNVKCKTYKQERWGAKKFCDECGQKIGEIEISVKQNKVDTNVLSDELNEAMTVPSGDSFHDLTRDNKIDIWYGNRQDGIGISFDPKDEVMYEEFESNTIKVQIDDFVKEYAKELEIIKNAYGAENVSVKWGLIHQIW
jgi:hypothetical protein